MAKESISKTNAVRLLDQLGIRYELREYEVDPDDLAAETVAAKIGLPPEQVFKTLVARGDRNGIVMAVILRRSGTQLEGAGGRGGRKKNSTRPGERTASPHRLHSRRRDGAGGQARLSGVRGRDD